MSNQQLRLLWQSSTQAEDVPPIDITAMRQVPTFHERIIALRQRYEPRRLDEDSLVAMWLDYAALHAARHAKGAAE